MNNLTIVVEGRLDAILLRRLFSKYEAIPLRFYAAQGRESLATLGRNILVHEVRPVLIVMDADTLDLRRAVEHCRMVEVLLRRLRPKINPRHSHSCRNWKLSSSSRRRCWCGSSARRTSVQR